MSFSTEQKADIFSQPIKSVCCKRALLAGIVTSKGSAKDGLITAAVDSKATAQEVAEVIRAAYSKGADITTMPKGGRGYLVSFSAPSCVNVLNDFLGGGEPFAEKCPQCQCNFLRGLFIACGRVTDPTKQYLLEFTPKNELDRFVSLFDELGLEPRVSKKPRETVIYFKNSTAIEDFFALAAMNNAAFALMNAKIQGEIRNSVNRIANCETNNINKAVSASVGQIALISELINTGLITQLPDELKKTALLRVEHSDLSLSQLAALITPYISKPGLSHRLRRITEIGTELLEKHKKKS